MPWISEGLAKRVAQSQRAHLDRLAREQAEQKLDEIEARLDAEIQRRGLAPVTDGTGRVIAHVPTRPDPNFDPYTKRSK